MATVIHGPCPGCDAGSLTQFPESIDAVCVLADHASKCPRCNKRVDRCAVSGHTVGADTCPWPPPWSCGYWRQADQLPGSLK